MQVFHFNGAAPITKYSKVLTTAPINWIRWDKANHLYALSTEWQVVRVHDHADEHCRGSGLSLHSQRPGRIVCGAQVELLVRSARVR